MMYEMEAISFLPPIVTPRSNLASRFALKNVVPGKYHAFAWEKVSWDDFTDADFLREFESQGVAVSVGENEKKTLDLKLIPATGNK